MAGEWSPLVQTAGGGVLALAGVWLSHYFSERRELRRVERDERKTELQLLRTKLEELYSSVALHDEDLTRRSSSLLSGIAGGPGAQDIGALFVTLMQSPSHLTRAAQLQQLYFPQLREPIVAMQEATKSVVQILLDISQELANGQSIATRGEVLISFTAPLKSRLDAFAASKAALAAKGVAVMKEIRLPQEVR